MRCIEPIRSVGGPSGFATGALRAAGLALGMLAAMQPAGRAWASTGGPIVLKDEAMDSISAAQIRMQLELSANATGPAAMTSTNGSVVTGQTTALRIALDPTAPAEAQAKLLGVSSVDVGIAAGTAQASGADHVDCTANVAIEGGDYTFIQQTQNFTTISATCNCTALAIGFLTH